MRARDGARGPGDLGFARTEAKRRQSNLRALSGLETTKKVISFGYYLFVVMRARDGDRTGFSPDKPSKIKEENTLSTKCLQFVFR